MADPLAYFAELGDLVDQLWSAKGRHTDQLADVATAALQEVVVPEELTPSWVLGTLTDGTALPTQRSSSDQFGQPPAIMYRHEELEVQALTWMQGSTAIHQHGFDGAFRVLAGSSLHVEHTFDRSDEVSDGHLVVGELAPGKPEILRPGDVRPIVSGTGFIHALFHLERPSVTIVVRNGTTAHSLPQYSYRLPGIGVDNFHVDDGLVLRFRGLHSLHQIDKDGAIRVALEIVGTQDIWTAFKMCDYWAYNCGEGPPLEALIEVLSRRVGPMAELLHPMYAEEMRRGRLLARRGMMREQRHRLFLALIVNLPDRLSIHSAIAQLYPGQNPDEVIMRLVEELSSAEYRGISGLALGPDQLEVLQAKLLEGGTEAALGDVASTWNPPSMLEKLFV